MTDTTITQPEESEVTFVTASANLGGFEVDSISPGDVRAAFDQARVDKVDTYITQITADGVGPVVVPNYKAIAKANGRVLNMVSPGYEIHQYTETLLGPAQDLIQVADGGAFIQAYGLTGWGGKAFISIGLTEPVNVGGVDIVNPYAFLSGSADGSWATTARIGNYRMFCKNQLASFQRGLAAIKIRHTSKSAERLPEINAILTALVTESEALKVTAEALLATPFTLEQTLGVFNQLDPKPIATEKNKATVTNWVTRKDKIVNTYRFDPRVAEFTDTAWGAYQTFSTVNLHGGNVRQNRDARTVELVTNGKIDSYDHKVLSLIGAAA